MERCRRRPARRRGRAMRPPGSGGEELPDDTGGRDAERHRRADEEPTTRDAVGVGGTRVARGRRAVIADREQPPAHEHERERPAAAPAVAGSASTALAVGRVRAATAPIAPNTPRLASPTCGRAPRRCRAPPRSRPPPPRCRPAAPPCRRCRRRSIATSFSHGARGRSWPSPRRRPGSFVADEPGDEVCHAEGHGGRRQSEPHARPSSHMYRFAPDDARDVRPGRTVRLPWIR